MSETKSFITKRIDELLEDLRTEPWLLDDKDLRASLGRIAECLKPKVSPVPVVDILSLYHNLLPSLPKVIRLNEKRRTHLVARWNESPDQQSLEFWRAYFRSVAASDFLTGKTSRWSANFDWLVNPTNILKVLEGNYRNREEKNGATAATRQLFDSVQLEQQRRTNGRSI